MISLTGAELIKDQLKTIPHSPGVYRMLDEFAKVLYVGKAKDLPKRLINYTSPSKLSNRIQKMVSLTRKLEIITTKTEAEALLLEASLIKSLQPRYNILLRDDKSFPYILIRKDHDFAQLTKYRGNKKESGDYYGPFASVGDVNNTIKELQKIFQLRTCSDNYFKDRKRPCILYQIKRCSAPCTGKISKEEYQRLTDQANSFLSGKTITLQENLAKEMEQASQNMEYEKAAIFRDRIRALTSIQSKHNLMGVPEADSDIIACYSEFSRFCIQIFFLRAGQNYGNKSYFPAHTEDAAIKDVLSAFIGQFYQNRTPPKQILLSDEIDDVGTIEDALSLTAGLKVSIKTPKAGDKKKLVDFVMMNAKEELTRKISEQEKYANILLKIQKLFNIDKLPRRIEVYDNSHIMGKHAVGAMIVSINGEFQKDEYRKFNFDSLIKSNMTGGDDYAMLREMLTRRFKSLLEKSKTYEEDIWPDLLLIDGGQGHFNVAANVMEEFALNGKITLASIAKGPDRNAGEEFFFTDFKEAFSLNNSLSEMKFLQILRDEAHRFAIGSHRKRRSMAIKVSEIDSIPNIGPKRKKMLLSHFGSIDAIKNASVEDLAKLDGINKNIAKTIYNYLHFKQ